MDTRIFKQMQDDDAELDHEKVRTEAYLDSIVRSASPAMAERGDYWSSDIEEKARIASRAVDGLVVEIAQLRRGSKMEPKTLYAATDTPLEELEQHAVSLIATLPKAGRGPMQKRLDAYLKAWRVFLGMSSERAAFQSACNVVKEIRRRAIYCAVGLDRLVEHDGVQVSNTAANDFAVLTQALCEIGGQSEVRHCHQYVKDHGEGLNTGDRGQ